MIKLYHAPFTRSIRILWLLEELGVPYQLERGPFLQWVHFAEATALPPVGDIVRHTVFKPEAERIPAVVEDARGRLDRTLDVVENALEDRDYLLASGFSAADVMMGVSLFIMRRLKCLDPKFTKLAAYLAR